MSGESGAGKTFNARLCMNFLTELSSRGDSGDKKDSIENKVNLLYLF